MRSKLLAVPFTLALLVGASACSDDTQDDVDATVEELQEDAGNVADDAGEAIDDMSNDAAEAAARNLAAMQGKDEFESNGIEVDGDLDCEATTEGDNAMLDVTCTGTGADGQELSLEGTTDEVPGASLTELEGTFTGTADGEEVFTVDTLGG